MGRTRRRDLTPTSFPFTTTASTTTFPTRTPILMTAKHPQRLSTSSHLLTLALLVAGCRPGAASTTADPSTEDGAAASDPLQTSPFAARVPAYAGPVPQMPHAVTSFGAADLDGEVYLLGGYHGTPHAYSREGQSGRFARFDPTTGEWSELPGIEGLQSVTLTAVGDRLVRVGGMRADNAAGEPSRIHSVTEVSSFDPTTGTWTDLPPLPEARSSHDAIAVGKTLYVVGGWTLEIGDVQGRFADHALRIDLSQTEPRWERLPQPFSRRALAVATDGRSLWALGGMDENNRPSTRCDRLDPEGVAWSRCPDLPQPGFGAAAAWDGEAVVTSAMDGHVQRLVPEASAWHSAGTLAFPRFFHRMVSFDGRLWAVGGIRGMTTDDRITHLEPLPTVEDGPMILTWEFPWPGHAKNRQALVLDGDALWIAGGNNSLEQHDFAAENFVDEVWRLHLGSLRVEAGPRLPIPRQSMVVAQSEGDHFELLGGFGWDGEVARTHPDLLRFDGKAWTETKDVLPIPLSQFAYVADAGEARLVGGLDYDPRRPADAQFIHNETIFVRDGDVFQASDAHFPKRRAFASARLGDHYYVVGGMRDGFERVENCGYFPAGDPTAFVEIPCPAKPGLGAELVAVDGTLVLVRGRIALEDGDAGEAAVSRYDAEQRRWLPVLDTLPIEPTHLHVLEHDGRLLLFSTHNDRGVAQLVSVKLSSDPA